eukprot:6360301-Lingulodinium_polyedra.AAC.1
MMRSNRLSAAAAPGESHASHTPCKHQTWCLHGVREACDLRTVATANGRFGPHRCARFRDRAQ